jgi:hypothetical protein
MCPAMYLLVVGIGCKMNGNELMPNDTKKYVPLVYVPNDTKKYVPLVYVPLV